MSFFYGFTEELEKVAGESGPMAYGHGDGKEKKKPSYAKGAVGGAVAGGVANHAIGEAVRRDKRTPFELLERATTAGKGGHSAMGQAKDLLATGGKAGPWHGQIAKHLPAAILAGAIGGVGVQGVRRAMHHGEKKEAGIFGHAPKPGMLSRMAAKAPKKAIGAAALGAGAYGVGKHKGKREGEGEAMQVGEMAYEAGARDGQQALLQQLGVS